MTKVHPMIELVYARREIEPSGAESLEEAEREQLRDILADALVEVGLGADDEPNRLGLQTDSIIGKLRFY